VIIHIRSLLFVRRRLKLLIVEDDATEGVLGQLYVSFLGGEHSQTDVEVAEASVGQIACLLENLRVLYTLLQL